MRDSIALHSDRMRVEAAVPPPTELQTRYAFLAELEPTVCYVIIMIPLSRALADYLGVNRKRNIIHKHSLHSTLYILWARCNKKKRWPKEQSTSNTLQHMETEILHR